MHACLSHALHIVFAKNAALSDQKRIFRHIGQHRQRGVERDFKAAQIAVVDPEHGLGRHIFELQGALHLRPVMHFHEHRHIQAQRAGLQISHLRIIEAGGDQQNTVCTHRTRFVDLIGLNHEIFAQHRQFAGGAGELEKIRLTLEKLPICEHREAGR